MRNTILKSVAIIFIALLIPPKLVHANTLVYTEAPGTSWINLNSNTGNTNYLIHNSGDNNSLEFAANSPAGMKWQTLSIVKNGSVGVGSNQTTDNKFLVNTNSGWAAKFSSNGADIRLGNNNGTGIYMNSGPGTSGYQMRIFQNSVLKFEIQADGKTFIDNTLSAKKVVVKSSVWADYVFGKDYKLPTLKSVEKYINKNGHLPGIESEEEIIKNGISVSDMQAKQMAKIEELTLYAIQQEKEIKELKTRLEKVEKFINNLN